MNHPGDAHVNPAATLNPKTHCDCAGHWQAALAVVRFCQVLRSPRRPSQRTDYLSESHRGAILSRACTDRICTQLAQLLAGTHAGSPCQGATRTHSAHRP